MTMVNKLMEYPSICRQPVAAYSIIMDASGERCAMVQYVKTAGDIAKVIFYNTSITSGDTIKASIQTVNLSTGNPSGTVWATATGNKAYGTVAITTGDTGWHTVTFTEVAPVVAGDLIAIVFEFNSYVSGNLRFYANVQFGSSISPYYLHDVGGAGWVKGGATNSGLQLVLEYSGGNYYLNQNNEGAGCVSGISVTTATTPDEIGNYFQVPFTMRAYGMCFYGDPDGDFTLSILNASGTVLANAVLDAQSRALTGVGAVNVTFDTDPAGTVTLQPDTWYRMVLTPNSTTASLMNYLDMPSAAAMATLDGGTLCYATSRVDGGSWTNLTTRRWAIAVLIDQIDIPTGGSGGGCPVMGGMVMR